jgi:hypothetical protein
MVALKNIKRYNCIFGIFFIYFRVDAHPPAGAHKPDRVAWTRTYSGSCPEIAAAPGSRAGSCRCGWKRTLCSAALLEDLAGKRPEQNILPRPTSFSILPAMFVIERFYDLAGGLRNLVLVAHPCPAAQKGIGTLMPGMHDWQVIAPNGMTCRPVRCALIKLAARQIGSLKMSLLAFPQRRYVTPGYDGIPRQSWRPSLITTSDGQGW